MSFPIEKQVEALGQIVNTNSKKLEGLEFHGYWKDQNGDRHVSCVGPDGELQLLCTRSREFTKWIQRNTYRQNGQVLNKNQLEKTVALFDAITEIEGEELRLSNRVAKLDKDTICIDTGKGAIFVDESGWRSKLLAKPLFRRYAGMLPLSEPVVGGDIRKVLKFLNFKDELDQLLFLVYLVFAFVPEVPHPILTLFGPQGASKTTAMKLFMALVDPNVIADVHTYSEMEFQLAAIRRWVLGLDNLSGISKKLSDTLCKVVTGMGFTQRALYTTDDMITQQYMRVILMNGVNLPVDKPDLMDRCLLISLERISNDVRKDEATLFGEFDLVKGEILGGCLDALSKAIEIFPSVPKHFNSRMLDFARWGCAIAEALGYSREQFLAAIERNTLRQNEESLDASPIAAILHFCFTNTDLPLLKGTPTEILKELQDKANAAGINLRALPQTPRALGKKLMEIKPNLEAEGYGVYFNRGGNRVWTIEPPVKLREEYLTSLTSSKTRSFSSHLSSVSY